MPWQVVPMQRRHIAGFRELLDRVARERRYLAFLEAPPMPRVRRFVLNNLRNGAPQLVALDEGAVVGWCEITPKVPITLQHGGVLGMGVAASHRGIGVGAGLLQEALQAATLRGLTRIELVVRTDNDPAIRLYRRFGFEVEGRLRNYLVVDGHAQDVLAMARVARVVSGLQDPQSSRSDR
jgi:ribosomal protein S18 acetylase RimI-like enzyme